MVMVSDVVSDMLTRIRNGYLAGHTIVKVPASSFRLSILDVMRRTGYVGEVEVHEVNPHVKEIRIPLKYYGGKPVIKWMRRLSSPGCRHYVGMRHGKKLPLFRNGLGVYVLSTSKGVLSDAEARKEGVGGELLFEIF